MPGSNGATLKDVLAKRTREGILYEKLEGGKVRCFACGHRCPIPDGAEGVCKVRFNRGGELRVPHGYVAGVHVDPMEKKPFYHAYPGEKALSFGMLGCDFHCDYCQNWVSSQALRNPVAGTPIEEVTAEELVAWGKKRGATVVTSTYNEPLITAEWAMSVFLEAKEHGLVCGFVSNGNGTPEVLEFLRPAMDLFKIDLKGFRDPEYRKLGGVLQNVCDTIRLAVEMRFWVEVVTLVVPGLNDSDEELRDIARFLVSVSVDIPWHVTAFHPDYKMEDRDFTPAKTLMRAAEIGRTEGLRYVYAGNIPCGTGDLENTRCPDCNGLLIERRGFTVLQNRLRDATCPDCREPIAGLWRRDPVF